MSPNDGAGRGEMRIFVFGIGALLVLVMWLVTAATAPRQPPPGARPPRPQMDYIANGDEAAGRVRRLAQETKGDFDRLPADDQNWLDAMSGGHGREMLRSRYQEQRGQAKPSGGPKGAKNAEGGKTR